ncbi:pilus assembly protein PilZ [Marinobacter sp. EhC06]|jgi:c-di-GMP-binding flagellar brake protein YcgR|uniref:PilZ domain-containing protein n=1 Tax=Marinobacter TaxID=2742 RepID=UPI0007D97025|nr:MULTISPECIES: PilZ domain-containing protein [unclassified Marinobacter]OAN90332.1 pilus assembly protein PilZ [Marinobacter sp. EhN04]OAN96948.1 pilus assembly protein PilZ [Marinobacter sp. EhC06]
MKDYSEKRDFHRMQVNSEIEITDSQGNRFKGVCRDLSAAGMQLYVEREVAVGEELQTVLHPTSDQFPPLETVCEVIRSEPEGDGFLLGTNISEVTR